ncbi:MAG: hypothetical protein V4671_31400 [Armatimonadota bacterium]
MPARNTEKTPRVVSKVFGLWKARELTEGRKITLEALTEEIGLAKMTVRRFAEPNGDVSGSPLSSVAVFAAYFAVPISEVVALGESEWQAEKSGTAIV